MNKSVNKDAEYDWDNLKLKTKTLGEFINIEDFEPDEFKRKMNFPYVVQIKSDIYEYVKPDGLSVKRTITTKKCHGNKRIIDRRHNWKPFGAAARNGNEGITTIGQEVFMELNGKHYGYGSKKHDSQNISSISKNSHKLESVKSDAGFKIAGFYKPNLNNINNTSKSENNEPGIFGFSGYVPKTIKTKMKNSKGLENFTIVIKNIPTDLDKDDVYYRLKNILKKFGDIKKLKILIEKNDPTQIRDIGFLEFQYAADGINFLKGSPRVILGSCILGFEKAKPRT